MHRSTLGQLQQRMTAGSAPRASPATSQPSRSARRVRRRGQVQALAHPLRPLALPLLPRLHLVLRLVASPSASALAAAHPPSSPTLLPHSLTLLLRHQQLRRSGFQQAQAARQLRQRSPGLQAVLVLLLVRLVPRRRGLPQQLQLPLLLLLHRSLGLALQHLQPALVPVLAQHSPHSHSHNSHSHSRSRR